MLSRTTLRALCRARHVASRVRPGAGQQVARALRTTAKPAMLPRAQRHGFASLPEHRVEGMPALSPTMEQGNLASWSVAVGDEISEGQSLAQVETDKATVDFEATDAGYVAKILVPAGTPDVAVGTPLVVICEEASDVGAFADFSGDAAAAPAAAAAAPTPAAPAATTMVTVREALNAAMDEELER